MAERKVDVADPDAQAHLAGFIRAFVEPSAQPRWRHVLLEASAKAGDYLHKFEHHRHKDRTWPIPHHAWISLLRGTLAEVRGLYFDGHESAAMLNGAEVLARLSPFAEDALWSITVGVEAYFFLHDGQGWACRREL